VHFLMRRAAVAEKSDAAIGVSLRHKTASLTRRYTKPFAKRETARSSRADCVPVPRSVPRWEEDVRWNRGVS
jgi:hypothetical protein